ncbi:hypothetical protein [Flavobacterium tibetense]|jgi:hypothetical protein|uniref:Uncharacterized protein n=1 Tax=Flavobacterium tibetense TaxID=2233533 RepID=A0A365P5L9_9FLAO|nr:hypothetical protein [Flavobacterium tibetense]RBA29890.1 hypothetical protein DPN68_01295 [Flavobacterium tibetense]
MKKISLTTERESFASFTRIMVIFVLIIALIFGIYLNKIGLIIINAFFLIIILPSTIYRYYKFKEINFDSHYLYFDEKKILIRNVKEIGNGYIIYINNNKEFKVYYNYSFFNKNLEKLREVHKAQSTIS